MNTQSLLKVYRNNNKDLRASFLPDCERWRVMLFECTYVSIFLWYALKPKRIVVIVHLRISLNINEYRESKYRECDWLE